MDVWERHASAGRVILLGVAITCALGCGSSRPTVYPVELKLLFNGSPAVGAEAVLHPADGPVKRQGLLPNGRADETGVVRLTTYEPGDGAPAGKYAITVVWAAKKKAGNADPEAADAGGDQLRGRYARPADSSLNLEVTAGKANAATFDLAKR